VFSAYSFEDRQSDKTVTLGRASYVWAGLFGGAYLIFKAGPRSLLRGVLLLVVFTMAIAGLIFGAARFVPDAQQPIVLLVGMAAILLMQSLKTCEQVKHCYHLRGWRIRLAD
jgi:asparagine N-glycosylation enzyme membrane subunit Stt3